MSQNESYCLPFSLAIFFNFDPHSVLNASSTCNYFRLAFTGQNDDKWKSILVKEIGQESTNNLLIAKGNVKCWKLWINYVYHRSYPFVLASSTIKDKSMKLKKEKWSNGSMLVHNYYLKYFITPE